MRGAAGGVSGRRCRWLRCGVTSVPELFPRPRRVVVDGAHGVATVAEVALDAALPAQGYRLEVRPEGTTIRHADAAGLRYARQTLDQLAASPSLPGLQVEDHPDHLRRGFMLDISRDRVPTNATLRRLVSHLAELRYNHLELYVEHTYAHAGHDVVWRGASPLTAQDVRWLDAECAAHGIELVANRNTFGHMERWLRHDRYRPLAECPDGAISPFTGRPMPPATLAPTAASAELALSLVRELAAQVASPLVNIGADEPFELGQGASAAAVAQQGRAEVYLEHLLRLVQPLVAEGHHVLFWGDVLRRHPELVARLPTEGVTAVVWWYDAPSEEPGLMGRLAPAVLESLGLPDDFHRGFSAHVRSFADSGFPFWVAAGTSSWNSLVGRWANARANLLDAARVGLDQGGRGLVVTDWGDNGHLQPLVVSLLPLAYGAGVAWCAATNADADVAPVVDRLEGTPGLGALLTDLGDAYLLPGVETVNASPLFVALDPHRPGPLVGRGAPHAHRATLERLEAGLATAERLGRGDLVAAVRLARQGAWRLAARAGVPGPSPDRLRDDLAEAVERQRAAWANSSRPGGLADSLGHLPAP